MKTLLVFLAFLYPNFLSSQDFQNICSPGVTMYSDSIGNLKGFRVDSVRLAGINDSVFIPFNTVRMVPGQPWVDTTGGTILGKRITRRNDGWFIFINQDGDSIRINTHAGQNDFWNFMQLPEKQYLQARISATVLDTIMGMADSIKVLELQALDSLANPIPHPCNNLQFRLSKHYGLTQTYNLSIFPTLSIKYTLSGKTNPKVGIQPLSMREVYDFNIGDEFHYSEYEKTLDYHGSEYNIWYIWHIIAKTLSQDSSYVTYSIGQCLHETAYTFPDPNTHIINSQDTLSITYNFSQLEAAYWFERLPDEFKCIKESSGWRYANLYERALVSYSGTGRVRNKIRFNAYISTPETSYDWEPWDTAMPNIPLKKYIYFATGIGMTAATEYAYMGYTHNKGLTFYRKGPETWGTPVAKDCNELLGKVEPAPANTPVIQIMPDPVLTQAKIVVSDFMQNDNSNLVLYDYRGNRVFKKVINSNPFIFDRGTLSAGFYLLVYQDSNGKIKGKLKIILQ